MQLKPKMRHAIQPNGTAVVVKLLHSDSNELRIFKHLHSIKSPYNHTIPLLKMFELDMRTSIFLPEATSIDLGFNLGRVCGFQSGHSYLIVLVLHSIKCPDHIPAKARPLVYFEVGRNSACSWSRIVSNHVSLDKGQILAQSLSQLERDIHLVVIISAYNKALQTVLKIVS